MLWRVCKGTTVAVLATAFMASGQETTARPGALNAVEGQVTLNGQTIAPAALAATEAAPGQLLASEQGKAELLLTPGVFVRLSEQGAVKMDSQALASPRIELVSGEALVEVAQLGNARLEVIDGAARVRLERPGIYEFRAGQASVSVFVGRAQVQANDRTAEVGRGRQASWNGDSGIAVKKFDRGHGDGLYVWSAERARSEAAASVNTSLAMAGTNPDYWHGGGWYWNQFAGGWVFLPAGCAMAGPFGETFVSPPYNHAYTGTNEHTAGYWKLAE